MVQIKPLDVVIHGKGRLAGFTYEQIKKEDNVAYLYRVMDEDKGGKISHYEVFKHTERKGGEFHGKIIDPYVAYPGDEAFGKWAWTKKYFNGAMELFDNIVKEAKEKSGGN
jgi:hypothetical protein